MMVGNIEMRTTLRALLVVCAALLSACGGRTHSEGSEPTDTLQVQQPNGVYAFEEEDPSIPDETQPLDTTKSGGWGRRIIAVPVSSHGEPPALDDLLEPRDPSTRDLGYRRRCAHPLPSSLVLVSPAPKERPQIFIAYRDSISGQTAIKPLRMPSIADTLRLVVVNAFCGEFSDAPETFHLRHGPHHIFYDAGMVVFGWKDSNYPILFGLHPDGSISQLTWNHSNNRIQTAEQSFAWHDNNLTRYVARRERSGMEASIARAIAQRQILLGMTAENVIEAWGRPRDINRTVTAYGRHEQWVYGHVYVYLENGRVVAWQD